MKCPALQLTHTSWPIGSGTPCPASDCTFSDYLSCDQPYSVPLALHEGPCAEGPLAMPLRHVILNSDIFSQDGVPETGVSVAFTVRAMDAGPILAQVRFQVMMSTKVLTAMASSRATWFGQGA